MKSKYPSPTGPLMVLKDDLAAEPRDPLPESMVRTQIYLTRAEHEFLQTEANRQGEPMAAIIRGFIEEKMRPPEDAWTGNPLLEPTVDDPDYSGHEDSAVNHDHYIYGAPKKYAKRRGKWVLSPPLNE